MSVSAREDDVLPQMRFRLEGHIQVPHAVEGLKHRRPELLCPLPAQILQQKLICHTSCHRLSSGWGVRRNRVTAEPEEHPLGNERLHVLKEESVVEQN